MALGKFQHDFTRRLRTAIITLSEAFFTMNRSLLISEKKVRYENSKESGSSLKSNNDEKLALLEAALYVAGRPLDLQTLGSIIEVHSDDDVLKLARQLMRKYEGWNTSLEIREFRKHRFVLQLKPEYTKKVKRLSIRPILTEGPLKTLSYIAYHQPVSQTQVSEARGSHAYRHLKQLEKGFITREDKGRTKIVRTTDYFADYFGFSRNIISMKRQLRKIFRKLK